jgi:hypothetical protein
MKTTKTFFHCGEQLQKTLQEEISEIESVVERIEWFPSYQYKVNGNTYEHQTGYNKSLGGTMGTSIRL